MDYNKPNLIVDKSLNFAINIIKYCEILESNRKFVIANQLLKSGTSIGANVNEAQNGESKLDFIHKLKIAAKEAEETRYWLKLCNLSENYPDVRELMSEIEVIIKIINKIIASRKRINNS